MTDNKPQPSAPQAPPLTEEERVSRQVGATDLTTGASRAMAGVFPFGAAPRFFGTTDFEGHRLNDMIDLVENANPEHLTGAGDSLFAAHKAIEEAAGALDKDIARVAWEGEAGNAFRDWGKALAGHARTLGDFASTAGVQITAAGTGLASVRQAMPPRDHRAEPVKATELPAEKRVAGNAEYEAAVRGEEDRQEAINQMNRLSSFYAVSEQTLAAQQPPVFQPMPAVGVPKPTSGYGFEPRPSRGGSGRAPGDEAVTRHAVEGSSGPGSSRTEITGGAESPGAPAHHTRPGSLPDRPVATEINSVVPLPTTVPNQSTTAQGSPVTATDAGLITEPPFGGVFSKPTAGGSVRAYAAGRGSALTETREGTANVTARGATGPSTTNPGGRVASSAPEGGRGRPSSAVGQSPLGRGVSGGTPRAGGAAPSRAGTARSGSNGIVGGRPSVGAPGSAGPRTSKPTVVGTRGAAGEAAPVGRPGRRGVVGAAEPAPAGQARTGGRAKGNADGVVGVPKGRSADRRGKRGEFTTGGAGLVRGTGEHEGSNDEEDETALSPGHLGEDEGRDLPSR
ncbi:WXG100 family type VII secretion target [Streptomyces sp. NBC_00083]|uniref:WXG100 family type VII secretion target n=1 Tax=Streptomyces sp. NBC_00083 TaxID=2975647 RepID=UPI00224D3D38|nr:hypothetical protein [Streptomyces sp. NBC_00083]MCX5386042.1 hypothetical protein [Streptomyces sp. NBC_00083]